MKTRIILIAIFLIGFVGAGLLISKSSGTTEPTTVSNKKPEQFIVLLDLSDRITQRGQIEADEQLIQSAFSEFEKKVRGHLVMNSKDRFQVCIAPQKDLPFDKDVESEKLTFDLSVIKIAERVKAMKAFEETLHSKLDSLYAKANRGNDKKIYQGSNIWQFFNETLPALSNNKIATRLIVLTDGYFDFEDNNAKLKSGSFSTTTNFLKKLRENEDWKAEMEKKNYGIMPVNKSFQNLSVCVSEIRSKYANNLNETEMLKYIWSNWLLRNNIENSRYQTILHSSASNSAKQLSEFLTCSI